MDISRKTSLLKKLKDEIVTLKQSPLYSYRTENNFMPVIGEGDHDAKIMFIGEAPGLNEAKTGRPFCGAAGRVLDQLLGSIDLKREDVYITNIVKDRPPDNRDPLPEEIELYAPFLLRQIEIIEPKVVITLGRHSTNLVLHEFDRDDAIEPISKMHGTMIPISKGKRTFSLFPSYHPAAALYNPSTRGLLLEDFKTLQQFLNI